MNLLANFSQGYDDVYGRLQQGNEQRARMRAGGALAGGDYSGASKELYGAGMLEDGSQVQNYGQAQEDRVTAQDKARKAEALGGLVRVSGALGQIVGADPRNPDDPETLQKRHQVLNQALSLMEKLGINTEPLRGLTPDQLTLQNIQMFGGNAQKELQFFQNDSGIYAGDKTTGQVKQVRAFAPRPLVLSEGQTAYDMSPGGQEAQAGPAAGGGFQNVIGGLLQREGGYVGRDGNSGAPANYGINQKHNPDIDVRNLTPEKAAQIYKSRYWDKINGDQLPPEAQAAVFDAAVNQGPEVALQMWQQSGGDVGRFNDLRRERYRQTPGYDKYGKSWERRVNETAGAARPASGPRVIAQAPSKPKRSYRDATPQELRQMGYPPGARAQVDTETGKLENIRQPTEAQNKATGYTKRVLGANDRLNVLAQRGVLKPTARTLISEKNGVTRITTSLPEDRQFIQAAKDWLAPILRKDTGAAVTDSELVTYMDMYIPRPEDDAQTLRQKADARQDAMVALSQETGGVYGATYGDRSFQTMRPKAKGTTTQGNRPPLTQIFGD